LVSEALGAFGGAAKPEREGGQTRDDHDPSAPARAITETYTI
jgi:hypothetical protein